MSKIDSIYLGLPENLALKVLIVKDNYRVNPLSKEPGGISVVVEYTDGQVLLYDKIKMPSKYIKQIISDHPTNLNKKFFDCTKIFSRVFVREKEFKEIWKDDKSLIELIDTLTNYDTKPDNNSDPEVEEKLIGSARNIMLM